MLHLHEATCDFSSRHSVPFPGSESDRTRCTRLVPISHVYLRSLSSISLPPPCNSLLNCNLASHSSQKPRIMSYGLSKPLRTQPHSIQLSCLLHAFLHSTSSSNTTSLYHIRSFHCFTLPPPTLFPHLHPPSLPHTPIHLPVLTLTIPYIHFFILPYPSPPQSILNPAKVQLNSLCVPLTNQLLTYCGSAPLCLSSTLQYEGEVENYSVLQEIFTHHST